MNTAIVWFRRDLRVQDNPALLACLSDGLNPVPVYIHDTNQQHWPTGAASAWWLHNSLVSLKTDLRRLGSDLLVFTGEPRTVILELIAASAASALYFNRQYEPENIIRDNNITTTLQEHHVSIHSYNASLLRDPRESVKPDGKPYRVFTPFWNRMMQQGVAQPGPGTIDHLAPIPPALRKLDTRSIDSLGYLPGIPWDHHFSSCWNPGERGAFEMLHRFADSAYGSYPEQRDIPALQATSHLSPHLHFGEIGPQRVWFEIQGAMTGKNAHGNIRAGEAFLRQLAWRDFAHHLLFYFPHTADQPLDDRFARFPWRKDFQQDLQRWQRGLTGIPIVDAGMRELWQTGYMHNRVRMLVASFLTKNLRIPWQEGARWFWDTLVDADLANNTFGWQWTAGCGADAAPYFRIFNPVTQGERFDPDGTYVRRWVKELASLPARWIHRPWEIPVHLGAQLGFRPGVDYPHPVVNPGESRAQALDIWNSLRKNS